VSNSGFSSNSDLPAAKGAEFVVEAKPDTQVEEMTQESTRDITDPIKKHKRL